MYKTFYRLLILIPIAMHCAAPSLQAADKRLNVFSADETLTIRSAEARMDERPNIIHFAGGFELRAEDWYLSSDNATLYGKLDDPETVVLSGSPAIILLNTVYEGKATTINGEAEQITYQRNSNSIRMEGNASISRDQHTMRGNEMEYSIENDHVSAGGTNGIQITVLPDNRD